MVLYYAQCDAYVVNPFGNSNSHIIQKIFDYKLYTYYIDFKNSKKKEENIESGSKDRIWNSGKFF